MPKGIPNPKPEEANGEKISKMEAMRRVLKEKGNECKAVEYQSYIMSEFGLEMSVDMISNYKSTILRGLAEKSAAAPAPKAEAKSAAAPAPKAPTKLAGGFSLDELEAVKALADKIGAEKVQQLAKALAK